MNLAPLGTGQLASPAGIGYDPLGQRVVLFGSDGTIHAGIFELDLATGHTAPLGPLTPLAAQLAACDVAHDGSIYGLTAYPGDVLRLDPAVGLVLVGTLPPPAGPPTLAWGLSITTDGRALVHDGRTTLRAFVVLSNTVTAPTPSPAYSGSLCLGGTLTRASTTLGTASATGTYAAHLDPTQLPGPLGPVTVAPGEVWHFQVWYRAPSASLTNAVSITFR